MSMDPNRWVKTIPFIGAKSNQEKYKLDSNRWVNTLSRKDDSTLILTNAISSSPKTGSGKKYLLTTIVFVMCLILVPVIKNETRNLQKEISNLQASINILKLDLHESTLEYEVITSPENISRLAKEYLESDFSFYKKSQIRLLDEETKILAKLEEKKVKKNFKKKRKKLPAEIKLQVAKRIEKRKTELRKLQEFYSSPSKVPRKMKLKIAKKIEKTKNEIKNIASTPKESIDLAKVQKWAGIQVVKAFFGIPIIPGR